MAREDSYIMRQKKAKEKYGIKDMNRKLIDDIRSRAEVDSVTLNRLEVLRKWNRLRRESLPGTSGHVGTNK